MSRIILLIVIFIMNITAIQISEQCRTDRCIVDGQVTALCSAGGKLYLGGQFSFNPKITGRSIDVIITYKNSVYIGGLFDQIDGRS